MNDSFTKICIANCIGFFCKIDQYYTFLCALSKDVYLHFDLLDSQNLDAKDKATFNSDWCHWCQTHHDNIIDFGIFGAIPWFYISKCVAILVFKTCHWVTDIVINLIMSWFSRHSKNACKKITFLTIYMYPDMKRHDVTIHILACLHCDHL